MGIVSLLERNYFLLTFSAGHTVSWVQECLNHQLCVVLRESVFVESDSHHRRVGVVGQFQPHFPYWRTYSGQDTTYTVHDATVVCSKVVSCLLSVNAKKLCTYV
jgi:hypothetical protein